MTIVLPIPNRSVSPNGSLSRSKAGIYAKAARIKRHRVRAMLKTKEALGQHFHKQGKPVPPFIGYSIAHYFPTAQYRDDDNADAACKAYRDGIADALGIDDRQLPKLKLSTRGKDAAHPRVEITLHITAP